MPLDAPIGPLSDWAARLNRRYEGLQAEALLACALHDPDLGRIALVSSFGADAVVLLHMVSHIAPETPVLFVDTEMLFAETLAYQEALAKRLALQDLRIVHASTLTTLVGDPKGDLHKRDPDACCALRKTAPLQAALAPFDAWITGRKRYQSGQRAGLQTFEAEGDLRIKINPLADWTPEDVQAYMRRHNLPAHPLVAKGYPSIGCAPCTSRVAPGEDPRAGRWRGAEKTECGIHFVNGRLQPAGENR